MGRSRCTPENGVLVAEIAYSAPVPMVGRVAEKYE